LTILFLWNLLNQFFRLYARALASSITKTKNGKKRITLKVINKNQTILSEWKVGKEKVHAHDYVT